MALLRHAGRWDRGHVTIRQTAVLVAAILLAACSAEGRAPVTTTPTTTDGRSLPSVETLASTPPKPTPAVTPKRKIATLKLVRWGAGYILVRSLGSPGSVAVLPFAEAKAYDKDDALLGRVQFKYPLPQVVHPGESMYAFSEYPVSGYSAEEIERIEMVPNAALRNLEDPPVYKASKVKINKDAEVTGTVTYVSGTSLISTVMYVLEFDKRGRPLRGIAYVDLLPDLSPGDTGRLRGTVLLTGEAKEVVIFPGASWFEEYPG